MLHLPPFTCLLWSGRPARRQCSDKSLRSTGRWRKWSCCGSRRRRTWLWLSSTASRTVLELWPACTTLSSTAVRWRFPLPNLEPDSFFVLISVPTFSSRQPIESFLSPFLLFSSMSIFYLLWLMIYANVYNSSKMPKTFDYYRSTNSRLHATLDQEDSYSRYLKRIETIVSRKPRPDVSSS